MSIVYLKVKIKSLAEEARIIRKEENKAKYQRRYLARKQGSEEEYSIANRLFWELRWHREDPVGTESRAALLAYGFLRGRTYRQIEALPQKPKLGKVYYPPNWKRVVDLVHKYGPAKQSREDVVAMVRLWSGNELITGQ